MGGRIKNLIGRQFGRLLVVKSLKLRVAGGNVVWECLCDCGNSSYPTGSNLLSGRTKSCGCLSKESRYARAGDITSERFGRLTAIHPTDRKSGNNIIWLCYCNCGIFCEASTGLLRAGKKKSCGCIKEELLRRRGEDHPLWDKTLTDAERFSRRDYPEYKEWREAIYERDSYVCQKCKSNKGGKLNAHHIESYAKNKKFRISIGNGITLCVDCHKNLHHIYGNDVGIESLNEWMEE